MSKDMSQERGAVLRELQLSLQRSSSSSVLFGQLLARKLDIYSTDLECLGFLLLRAEGVAAGDLAALTGLTTGAITGVIDRLEMAGFVRRDRDSKDRRKVLVRPDLAKIEQEIAPHYQSMLHTFDEIFEGYSNEELAILLRFHQRVEEVLRGEIEKLEL
ncbi:MarR family transcriptional regulator [Ktedonosporobacter rubrisoli]|uniref:MarR family transcriptional regulator n=1 Tax=Ktedonosporobacter rubrisoli TaxID=2509675 RepID=A0A4V0Z005_KTERU|nr:MarR family transcriptional regulator [Ktedonosporobacter rubrisoli]QBD81541.1 MarR family transcriptional regulator [Ktedonosporobacter rubrisoli]